MANKADREKKKEQQLSQPQNSQNGASREPETSLTPYRNASPVANRDWEPMSFLRDEFDRLFGRFFRNGLSPWPNGDRARHWGLDVSENDDSVEVRAEAPGFEPEDFDLEVRGDHLVLHAVHKGESEDKERGRREWHQQELLRSVPLPAGTDPDKVKAQYRNGILT